MLIFRIAPRGTFPFHWGRVKIVILDAYTANPGDLDWAGFAALGQLQKLWLHDTRLTDASVPHLAKLKQLKSLYLHRTRLTVEGVRRLQKALPKCRIFYRSATVPE